MLVIPLQGRLSSFPNVRHLTSLPPSLPPLPPPPSGLASPSPSHSLEATLAYQLLLLREAVTILPTPKLLLQLPTLQKMLDKALATPSRYVPSKRGGEGEGRQIITIITIVIIVLVIIIIVSYFFPQVV